MYDLIQRSFQDSARISIFEFFKTENPILNAFLSTVVFTCISFIFKTIYDSTYNRKPTHYLDSLKSIFVKKYAIEFEGKVNFVIAKYDTSAVISACFTDTFKALLVDILKNVDKNTSVHKLKEYITSKSNGNKTDENMYIITQDHDFLYHADLKIYASISLYSEYAEPDKKNGSVNTDTVTITLYSYHTPLSPIMNLVKDIKKNYISQLENERNGKQYIYTLSKTSLDESNSGYWREYPFESSRTFSNMFFEGKEDTLTKIQFFLENKEWYYRNGIPYTLGIGLHGPPGTGKTSFFKCLANMTGRHLVVISLKLIKTKRQLEDFFYEECYSNENRNHKIGFDKKIILIEDIDCMGDIVLKRTKTEKEKGKKLQNTTDMILQKIVENGEKSVSTDISVLVEDPITLDDILNLWDGLKETPGRILGISSNHYDKLDPALIRPGRIDITLNLDNASRGIIREMYSHFYTEDITKPMFSKIKDRFYSPAEITNCYIMNKDDPLGFVSRLEKNKKF